MTYHSDFLMAIKTRLGCTTPMNAWDLTKISRGRNNLQGFLSNKAPFEDSAII